MNDSPFKTYEVTKVETKTVATITEQNIGHIATLIKGTVDYSGDKPVLIEPDRSNGMVWRVGMEVGLLGPRKLINMSGFTTGSNVVNVREIQPEESL